MGLVVGCDPGLSGALALIDDTGRLEGVADMPTIISKRNKKTKKEMDFESLATILQEMRSAGANRAFIERVGSMPGQGVSSMFAFGKATGAVIAACHALGFRVTEVAPSKWKKYFDLAGQEKDAARELAIKRFKNKTVFSRKKDCGRADASFIGLYGALNVYD